MGDKKYVVAPPFPNNIPDPSRFVVFLAPQPLTLLKLLALEQDLWPHLVDAG